MHVETLGIKNFKSIKSLQLSCKKINLFIGEPNTGKSNILEAIGLLSSFPYGHINDFVRFVTMTDLFYDRILESPIRIDFNEDTVELEFKNGKFHASYIHRANVLDSNQTKRAFVDRLNYDGSSDGKQYQRDLEPFKYYQFKKALEFENQKSEFLNPPYGNNLLAILMTSKQLRGIIKEIFDKYGYRIVFRPQEGKIEVQKEMEDILFSFPYPLVSETLQRIIFYIAAIHSNKESVLSFEEPESHAFPYYTKYLAEKIALDENDNQYFISTHNPYFLTSILEKTPKKDVAIFAISLKKYQTQKKLLTEKQKEEILEMGSDTFFNINKFIS